MKELFAGIMMALAFQVVCAVAEEPSPADGELMAQDYVIGAWHLYRSRFLDASGRIVDNVNGHISHSEGQGYGMLLAVAADDRSSFDRIWNWTRENLFVREDGLAAWRWDPATQPHVEDVNNATDGDLLIAWALMRARLKWGDESYLGNAREVLGAVSANVVRTTDQGAILLPAVEGFDAESQEDGPVVNLSYWVFPAIADLGVISPEFPSAGLAKTGLALLERARFGPSGLPANWIGLGGDAVAPASAFDQHFGYDAVRIPLYLAWHSQDHASLLEAFEKNWVKAAGTAVQVIDLASGNAIGAMSDPGYQAIVELVLCSRDETASARRIRDFVPTDYYPSTLHMLSLLAMAERYPRCLADQ